MKTLSVIRFSNGPWKQNCFILHGVENTAIIVDPGSDALKIISLLEEEGLKPLAIINTHGHFDHIGAIAELTEHFHIPFYLHIGDEKLVKSANTYRLLFGSRKPMQIPGKPTLITDEDTSLKIGGYEFEILTTPGHTEGGVCFKIGDIIFTGDTALPSGPGRTDLPGGNKIKLNESILQLRELPSHLLAHPGHGSPRPLKDFWSRYDQ